MNFVSTSHWMHGRLQVHLRYTRDGVINAVEEIWFPTSPPERIMIFDDGIEVSPPLYAWL